MISITPISGMTLTTLIVTAVALSALGLRGESGMLQVLLVGGVVCTALSMSGSLVTQYKIGYWLGATPRSIELSQPRRRASSPPWPPPPSSCSWPACTASRPSPAHPHPPARPPAQRHGGGAAGRHGRRGRALVPVRDRRRLRGGRRDVRRLRARLRPRHVPAHGAELAARPRRGRGLVPAALLEGRGRRLRRGTRRAPSWPRASSPAGPSSASSRPCCASSRSRPERHLVPDLTQVPGARRVDRGLGQLVGSRRVPGPRCRGLLALPPAGAVESGIGSRFQEVRHEASRVPAHRFGRRRSGRPGRPRLSAPPLRRGEAEDRAGRRDPREDRHQGLPPVPGHRHQRRRQVLEPDPRPRLRRRRRAPAEPGWTRGSRSGTSPTSTGPTRTRTGP